MQCKLYNKFVFNILHIILSLTAIVGEYTNIKI